MSERFKCEILFPKITACQILPDAKNGVYKCGNFAQHLAAGRFPRYYTGYVPSVSGMYIMLKVREDYNQVYPFIASHGHPKLKIRAFFSIKSKLWSVSYETDGGIYLESNLGVSGPSINIQDVMDEDNGYLENGTLTVEYGFHVDAILGHNDIWTFNLRSKLFNYEKDNNTATFRGRAFRGRSNMQYSPKQLLAIHSPLFDHESKNVILQCEADDYYAGQCLQIANGVRLLLNFDCHQWLNIAEVGRMMKMMNVVHYCDSIIIRTSPSVLNNKMHLKRAIKLNMKQCVLSMLGLCDFKDLMEELREDLDEIPGEMMKMLVVKIFQGKA